MKIFLFLIFLVSSVHLLCAQSIRGIIVDTDTQGIVSATIRLLDEDSVLVKGATTDADGNYVIKNVNTGKYMLSCSCIGYIPEYTRVYVGNDDLEVPIITLNTANVQLSEVEIEGQSYIRLKDRVLIIPDKKQVKHASTGYDLLYNLMIPGMDIDRRGGKVGNFKGEVTLYIDGRKVDYREVQSLRPRDVEKVEYYELPTGQYVGDNTSINYITKKYKTGGYVSLDADQTIGYLKGDYNGVVKLTKENTHYTLFGGHQMGSYDGVRNTTDEQFHFDDYDVFRHSETVDGKTKSNSQYGQLHVMNRNKKRTLMTKLSLIRSASPDVFQSNQLDYNGSYDFTQQSHSRNHSKSIMPGVHLYGNFDLGKNRWLEATLNGNYTHNAYTRDYTENKFQSHTDVAEQFYKIGGHLKYTTPFKRNNSLSIKLDHLHNVSSSTYSGDYDNWQHLWTSETFLFTQYAQRIGQRFSWSASPGFSLLMYRLHGHKRFTYFSPRFNLNFSYRPANNQFLYLASALGNNFPEISSTNSVDQAVDFMQIKRGNPNLEKATAWAINLVYAIQTKKVNIQLVTQYYRILNMTRNNYYLEGDKLINSFSDGVDNHNMMAELSFTWKMTQNLHFKNKTYAVRWIYSHPSLTHNTLTSGADIIYYWKDFAFNLSASTPYKVVNNVLFRTKHAATYGASARWSYNGWQIEAGTHLPFTAHSKNVNNLDTDVYSYHTTQYSRTFQQTGYIKVAYTFDFGRKTERVEKDVNKKINSAILKVE